MSRIYIGKKRDIQLNMIDDYDIWWRDGTNTIVLEFPCFKSDPERHTLIDDDGETFVYYCEYDLDSKKISYYRCYKSSCTEEESLIPICFAGFQTEYIKKLISREGILI